MIKRIQKTILKILEEELITVLAVSIVALGVLWVRADSDVSITASLTVYPVGGQIVVTAPNGGENWTVGNVYNITWTSAGPVNNVKIEIQRSAGGSWSEIIASTEDDGSHPWTVTSPATTTAKVKISKVGDDTVDDESNGTFTISAVGGGGGGGGGGTVYYPPLPEEEGALPPMVDDAGTIKLVDIEPKEIYSLLGAYLKPKLEAPIVVTPLVIIQPSKVLDLPKIELLPRLVEVLSIQDIKKLLVLEVEIKPQVLPPGEYDLVVKVDPERIIVAPEAVKAHGGVLTAKWVRQSDYPTVAPGEEFEMWVEFENTGTVPWLREVPAQIRLGTSRPRDHGSLFQDESWPSKNRLAVIDKDILPGNVGHFAFKMKAPSKIGTYREYVEPIAEFSEWIGPDWGVYWDITVKDGVTQVAPSTGGEPTVKTPLIKRIIPSAPSEFRDTTENFLRSLTQIINRLFSGIGNLFSGWF